MAPKSKAVKASPGGAAAAVPNGSAPGPAPTAASGPSSDPAHHLLVDDAIARDKVLANGTATPPARADAPSAAPASRTDLAYPLPKGISAETINNTESLLRFVILALISGAAIASRLFAVIRFESVIHEL